MQSSKALFLSVVILVGLAPAQDPPAARAAAREQRPVLSKRALSANKRTLAQMQGAWRLSDMQLVEHDAVLQDDSHLDHVGYCLVSGSYLSIEFHLRLLGKGQVDLGRSFVTGLHRFEMDEEGSIETSTVIATKTDPRGDPIFEPPDTKRHYTVVVAGGTMTLTRDDGHTLTFERLLDDSSRFDIFGDPVTEKEQADADEEGKKDEEKKEDGDEE